MSFSITVAGIEELSAFQMTTDVSIERRVYDHSRARITFEWVEDTPHSERRMAALAASCLNCTTDVQWKGYGAAEAVPCFHGYVEQAAADRAAGRSRLTLDCVSMSKRADLAPRYRAFQACQLLDICRQVAKAEPLIKIGQAGDLAFDIALSVQYGETDYAYLSRMLHAWGIPMAVSDQTGQVTLGARGVAAGGAFPDLDFRWSEVSFSGGTGHYPKRQNAGSGASHIARAQVDQLNGQVKPTATAYYPIPDSQPTRERHSAAHSQSDTSCYRLTFSGGVLAFSPGDVVAFEGQDHIVRAVRITGHPTVSTATQELELQPYTLPYAPEQHPPQWASRTLWAWVVANEQDPSQRGRIQVKFDLESLDPQASSEKVWLHTLTPYGGGKSPSGGKAGSYNGIYSLPEVGERVLVEFLGEWDSEAVVVGTVRQESVGPLFNAKDTKRWRLPSGTELAMTSKGGTEVVRLRCKDKIFLECKLDGANAEFYMTPGESDDDIIHFKRGGGPSSLYVQSGGTINVIAKQALHLEGQQVQIAASGGMVAIDGSPNVMLNCGPTPAQPLQRQKFQEAMGSTSGENRVLPSPIVGTAASGGNGSSSTAGPSGTKVASLSTVDKVQIVLTAAGMIPVVGEFANAASAGISLAQGDYAGAALSAAALIPIAGKAADVAKEARLAEKLAPEAEKLVQIEKEAQVVREAQDAEHIANVAKNETKDALINELGKQGIKHTPEDIVKIAKTQDGQIVFIEKGSEASGLNHIVKEHGNDFAGRGISEEQIPDAVMKAVTQGKVVGYQGRKMRRPVYEVDFNGTSQRIAVTTGKNGYIVGANPAR